MREHALLNFDVTCTLVPKTAGHSIPDVITQDPINTLFQLKSAKKSSELGQIYPTFCRCLVLIV